MIYKKKKIPRNRNTINIPLCLAFILLCFTLISTHLTSGIYARYSISDYSLDSAKAISFGSLDIIESEDFIEKNNLMIVPGVNINKKATVYFEGSESATYIFLELIAVPSGRWDSYNNNLFTLIYNDKEIMNWSIADKWNYLANTTDGRYIYYQSLAPNRVFNEDIIEDSIVEINELLTNEDMKNLNNIGEISIKYRAIAVQSNGFENPAAAWESISSY